MAKKRLESTIRKMERVKELFNELYVVGVMVRGKRVRMRYEDVIEEIAEKCFYKPVTVQAILKGQYLSYDKTPLPPTPLPPEGGLPETEPEPEHSEVDGVSEEG